MLSQLLLQWTGIQLFDYRLFRAGAASLVAAFLVFVLMPGYIKFLKHHDATSDFDHKKPPIFGGVLLVVVVLLSALAFCHLNAYTASTLVIMLVYAAVGFADDYMKIHIKRLIMRGQAEKKDYQDKADGLSSGVRLSLYFIFSFLVALFAYKFIPGLDGHLTVPFIKHELWYPYLPNWAFILLISFVITATANGANFTDGLDTLVSIPLITCASFLGVVAYVSGNAIFSKYLLLPYLVGADELLPICTSMIGALLAYLWFNCPPAEIYMGDAGSIGFGGAIGIMFVLVKAELFLPIIGIIFLVEAISVVLQIGGFKLTRRFCSDKQGRRLFLRAPIHDHFRLKWKAHYGGSLSASTSKVIWRFHLISLLALIVGSLVFFKIR